MYDVYTVKMILLYHNLQEAANNMDYSNFKMSKKQIQEFARTIFADIESYIETHREEYERFLKSEKSLDIQEEH